ncbi:hypothetical protein LSH36_1829g00008 [Paralvinella palmiformis]|uniref:Uncharacterized protein n=1 Tax=Paralvinella palmiformis TaxID=53620 RepID=A0AAD9IRK7_9ANNE|nr:hypothetical protein LSH36_1829g00008 [Paralvinella palmiformis]
MGVSSLSQTHQTYNGKLPMMFCTINAVLVAISIIISSCFIARKGEMGSDLIGSLVFMVVPAAYCQFFIHMRSTFSGVSDSPPLRCFLIANLMLAVIGAIVAFTLIGFSIAALWHRVMMLEGYNVWFFIALIWTGFSIMMCVIVIWYAVRCCQTVFCRSENVLASAVI